MLLSHDLVKPALGTPFTSKPVVRGWNRLEGRPRAENFERALRAEVRDPLWFLTRQWQFLELKGDDAGSPIEARVALRQTGLARYRSGGSGPVKDFPVDVPLETVVEREAPPFDRVMLMQIHRAFDKALPGAGLTAAQRSQIHAKMREAYPLPAQVDGVDDAEAQQLARLVDRHLFDANTFVDDVEAPPAFGDRIDALTGLSTAQWAAMKQAGADAVAWFRSLYAAPVDANSDAWTPSQLEYKFACATEPEEGQTVLTAEGYASGRLDWFAVDVARDAALLGTPGGDAVLPVEQTLSTLPVPVSFAGMPSHRFWEFENRKVEFGALTAHTTDIGKLLLTEFMLVYGNDWCLLPYEVSVGSLCEVLGIVVKDVFGDSVLIRAADRGQDEDWRRWAMFGLETLTENDRPPPRIFVPPTTPKLLESAPLEKVVFLRDEMANLCWAVERIVPSAAGLGIEGEPYAMSLVQQPAPDLPPAPGTTARYRLGTDAPPNWRPFLPVRQPGSQRSIRLQRARLPLQPQQALGEIIGAPPAPYFINEEEVPRAGRIVVRTFQRTRWLDGRVVLWLGRRTTTGRGEGSSGLAFDTLEEIPSRD
jgi:hypothetical protein